MRIAIVTNEFPALSETFISNKVLKFIEKGFEVFVICQTLNKHLFDHIFSGKKNIKVILVNRKNIFSFLFAHPLEIAGLLTAVKKKRYKYFNALKAGIINRCKPSVIHFEFSAIAFDYIGELDNMPAKKIVSCRGTAEKVKLLVSEKRKKLMKQLLAKVDAVHCVSGDMQATIEPYCSAPEKIFVNFPSIDTHIFRKKEAHSEHEVLNILSVGRLTFQKGYLTGLLAIQKLKHSGVKFQWSIVGHGIKHEELIFHINQLQLNKEVQLLGAKPTGDIIALYEAADIFFLPSVYEGIANAALEAMSMELPVVSTTGGGMNEVIEHSVDGLLSAIYDDESLFRSLLLLVSDAELRKRMGEAARKKIKTGFDIEMQIQKFESVYLKLLNNV